MGFGQFYWLHQFGTASVPQIIQEEALSFVITRLGLGLEWIAILTRRALDLTFKDYKIFTFVGHDCAAVRFTFENIARTFTGIRTERSTDVLIAKDNATLVFVYKGHISAKTFTLEVCRSIAAIQML